MDLSSSEDELPEVNITSKFHSSSEVEEPDEVKVTTVEREPSEVKVMRVSGCRKKEGRKARQEERVNSSPDSYG